MSAITKEKKTKIVEAKYLAGDKITFEKNTYIVNAAVKETQTYILSHTAEVDTILHIPFTQKGIRLKTRHPDNLDKFPEKKKTPKKSKFAVDDIVVFKDSLYRVLKLNSDKNQAEIFPVFGDFDNSEIAELDNLKIKKKAKLAKYEAGGFFSFSGDRYYVISVKPSNDVRLPAEYEVLNTRTGAVTLIHAETKGLSKVSEPSNKLVQAKDWWLGRKNRPTPPRVGELPSKVQFPNAFNIQWLANADDVGFDIETFGINNPEGGLDYREGRIRLMQAYIPEKDITLIWDLGGIDEPEKDINTVFGIDILRKKLTCRKTRIYVHYAAFESAWMAEKLQRPINNVIDSYLLSNIYWAGLTDSFTISGFAKPHSLSSVHLRLFGTRLDKTNQVYDYGLELGFDQYEYAALDAIAAVKCGSRLLGMCYRDGLGATVNAELRAIPAFAMLNYYGLVVDVPMLHEMRDKYVEVQEKVHQEVVAVVGEFTDSAKDLAPKLNAALGIEVATVGVDALKEYARLPEYDIINKLFLSRSLKKDIDYIDGYLRAVVEVGGFTAIRPNYQQMSNSVNQKGEVTGSGSGRTSSSNPNCQNIPKLSTVKEEVYGLPNIRNAFRVPDGWKLAVVDFSASHEAIARTASNDPGLLEAAASGVKFHFYTIVGLAAMEGVQAEAKDLAKAKKDKNHPLHELVIRLYGAAKIVFYAGLNLSGAATMQAQFMSKAGIEVDLETCRGYNRGIAIAYPALDAYKKSKIREANSFKNQCYFSFDDYDNNTVIRLKSSSKTNAPGLFGSVRSMSGARLFLPKRMDNSFSGEPEVKAADAVSFCWLREEANIAKHCLADLCDFFRYGKLKNGKRPRGRLYQFTHDEIGIIVHEEDSVEVALFMKSLMERRFQEVAPTYMDEDSGLPDDIAAAKMLGQSWSDVK